MKPHIPILSVCLCFSLSGFSEGSEEKANNNISTIDNRDSIVNRVAQFIGVWELFEAREQKTGAIIKNPLSLRIEFLRNGKVIMKYEQEGSKNQREQHEMEGEFSVSRNFITIYGRSKKGAWRYSEHYRYTLQGGILEFTDNSQDRMIHKLKKAEQDVAPDA